MAGNGAKHGDAVASKLRDQFRRNRAARERALRSRAAALRSSPSLADADFEETTEQRLAMLEARAPDSRPPGPVRWLWGTLDRLPGWGRVLVVLVVLGVMAWRGAAFLGWVP